MRIGRTLPTLGLALLCTVVGCSEELAPPAPDQPTIEPATFSRTLSDLVLARIELMPDTAAYEWRVGQILDRNQVSVEDLRTFVQVRGQDDDLMTGIYARVSARLDSLYPVARPEARRGIDAALDSLAGDGDETAP
jgi:hypothetical protein